ncbi:MAG: TlyA family RNA methyltransferase [Myxococcales bacterium]|nr:TlyA family RNA methyltransferase [Myxococcales bacterium]
MTDPRRPGSRPRLDELLVSRGLASDLQRAGALILAGAVVVGEARIDKSGTRVDPDVSIRIRGRGHDYVSRGGLKLLAALETYELSVEGRVALDLGASTGGFTDVLLRRGARRVYAVDVGHDQLDHRLRTDARVVSLEGTHARTLSTVLIPEPIDVLVADVSFISLTVVLPPAIAFCAPDAVAVVLVKPQFEAKRHEVERGGLVHDPAVHARVVDEVAVCLRASGFSPLPSLESPIRGAKGNREFLLVARRSLGEGSRVTGG